MTAPMWEPVDTDTADLLTLLADDATVSTDYEWELFLGCLRMAATFGGGDTIDPNRLRFMVRGSVKPARIGAFTRRAVLEEFVEYTGRYVVSDDTKGRNGGKPCRELRWIGGQR